MTRLVVAFRSFANALKNRHSYFWIGKIIAVYSEMRTNHINAFCGQNIGFFLKCRVSQEERAKLRESVPYVELYRYNPKHLYPMLNGYGDNGQRSLKL